MEEEREEGWPAVAHGAAGGSGGGRTQLLATVEVPAMMVLTVSSPIFFCFFFSSCSFFSFFSLGSLLSIPLFFLPLFSCASPLFIGKNRGERGRGGHYAAAPPTRGKFWASRGPWSASFWTKRRKKGSENTRERSFLPLFLCTSRGRRKSAVLFKTTPFWDFFFYEQCMKRRPFFTKHAISFKRKRRQKNMSEYKSVLNLWFVQSSPQLQFWFKNQCNCIPAKSKHRPWGWLPFSLWSLVLNLCNLTLNWAINF